MVGLTSYVLGVLKMRQGATEYCQRTFKRWRRIALTDKDVGHGSLARPLLQVVLNLLAVLTFIQSDQIQTSVWV